jgi:hypothetical protein
MGTLPMISTDDGTIGGTFESLYAGLEYLLREGPAYGYRLKKSKGTFLLGKCDNNDDAEEQKQRLVDLGLQETNIRV